MDNTASAAVHLLMVVLPFTATSLLRSNQVDLGVVGVVDPIQTSNVH